MARVLKYQNLVTLLVLLNFAFLTSARPLSVLQTVGCPDANNLFFYRFSLGSIKDGPSPGVGHRFEDKTTLGGIKFRASPRVQDGHEFTSIETLGGIKEGPSPGIGHKTINVEPLGGRKNAGPSHEDGHDSAIIQTLGGIKEGPSPGIGHKIINVESLGGRKSSGPSPGAGH
ncbi:hypothetical protein HanXRQr2_Chr09g0397031 [Helianthus annuus]|uniref:Uncharacterized protein n=1 Tax=Helianthus annuus TaxID=4232 RepID=A0A9K3I719_HELAN|nr:hypothetical protein HanXRQr2_Chr09g0397031 [Helianthus annuus]KAJ0893880.1 hypothetical protein HanPSC8_Chr09g0382791 [Helianthus annuus]